MTIRKRLTVSGILMVLVPVLLAAAIGSGCIYIIWTWTVKGGGAGFADSQEFYDVCESISGEVEAALREAGGDLRGSRRLQAICREIETEAMRLVIRSDGEALLDSGRHDRDDDSNTDSAAAADTSDTASASDSTSVVGTYSDENISITITQYRENDTTIYVADVVLSSAEYLQTAFAQSAYGRNVTAKTSETADSVGAILAINGDYYGSRESGYVIRNGVLYRSAAASDQEDLVIYSDGSFEIISESGVTAEELLAAGLILYFRDLRKGRHDGI